MNLLYTESPASMFSKAYISVQIFQKENTETCGYESEGAHPDEELT